MNIGIFTDSHYSSAEITCGCRYNSRSLDKIREAYRIFAEAGCEMVLCLGDLTDTEKTYEAECENLRACAAVIDASGIPTLCVMGNHDAFVFTEEAFYALIGEPHRPHTVTLGAVTLLFLDACHASDGRHYQPGGDFHWTDTCYPHTDALREQLQACTGEVWVCMHQNIDPAIREDHRLSNAAQIRDILSEFPSVTHVLQGHYHAGNDNTDGGIRYLTLPALCERDTAEAVRIFEV